MLISGKNEFEAYLRLLQYISENGCNNNRYREVLNCLLTIKYDQDAWLEYIDFKSVYLSLVGITAEKAWKRAVRVYTTFTDRMTKPSYLRRLREYKDNVNGNEIIVDQIDNIIHSLSIKPNYSILSFTILRPSDLLTMKRPGYVPCPIAGDFKLRKNKLYLNVFFRSQDSLNFGYVDIYFFRKLQIFVLEEVKKNTNNRIIAKADIGDLCFHFSRAYLPIRMEMVKKVYINQQELFEKTSNLISELKSIEARRNGSSLII